MSLKQLCFSYRGRINRAQYWGFGVISGILLLFITAMGESLSYSSSVFALLGVMLSGAGVLIIFYMGIPVSVKRLHDVGATGWTLLLLLVPILGAIILFVVTGFLKGDAETNKYGPPTEPINLPEHEYQP